MSRILLVEDYPPLATVLGVALRRAGHCAMRLDRVAKALALKEGFAGAVLDIDLTDGSGVDLAERLIDEGRVDWVIFFTANRTPSVLERARTLGVLIDKAAGVRPLLAAVESATAAAAKVVGAENATLTRTPGRSGTRKRVRR